ncbi:MAG: SIS domain-containing protein [Lachnospiraceae bacterium]|nr:SIS domain-containing protein [Lachnospiraceae bacterium]
MNLILDELIKRYPALDVCKNDIYKAYEIMVESYQRKGKLLVAGNGGSASDSEHIVGELMKSFVLERKLDEEYAAELMKVDAEIGAELADKLQGALPAIALDGHIALSTAYLNDVDPLLGFAQQVNGYGIKGDVFLGITTSGNSKNILYANTVAKAKGMKTIALTGKNGGKIKDMVDVAIVVPENETYKIQEYHLPIYHCLCLMLEKFFFE